MQDLDRGLDLGTSEGGHLEIKGLDLGRGDLDLETDTLDLERGDLDLETDTLGPEGRGLGTGDPGNDVPGHMIADLGHEIEDPEVHDPQTSALDLGIDGPGLRRDAMDRMKDALGLKIDPQGQLTGQSLEANKPLPDLEVVKLRKEIQMLKKVISEIQAQALLLTVAAMTMQKEMEMGQLSKLTSFHCFQK